SEAHAASQIAEKIGSIDAAIRELRSSTYVWARRPLLASSLILLLAMVGLASFNAQRQQSPFVEQDNSSSSLSEDQFKKIEPQAQAFRDRLLQQQAELHRQEAEATQARIAAAEREYKEKSERERAEREKEKREREQAQPDLQKKPATDPVRSQIEKGKAAAAAMMANLPNYPFPHDPELLDKLYEGRLEEIGPDRLDLIAVAKAFQRAGAIE